VRKEDVVEGRRRREQRKKRNIVLQDPVCFTSLEKRRQF
jgi:hypothetical protein